MNVWRQFKDLLPKQQQVIGKIKTVNANQTCIVTLLSGNDITVKGTGVQDSYYLIRDGVIVSEMPELTKHSITIY